MAYTIVVAPRAQKDVRRLSRAQQRRVLERVAAWADDPRAPGVDQLSEVEQLYRVRVGDYRVL